MLSKGLYKLIGLAEFWRTSSGKPGNRRPCLWLKSYKGGFNDRDRKDLTGYQPQNCTLIRGVMDPDKEDKRVAHKRQVKVRELPRKQYAHTCIRHNWRPIFMGCR